MMWEVDAAAPASLGEQIQASVRRALAIGELSPGERLPPAEELAQLMGINANTVLTAYRALRAEGIVDFRRGRGVRVAPTLEPVTLARAAVADAARAYLREGRRLGWDVEALTDLVRELA